MLQEAKAKAGDPPCPPSGRDIVAEARAAAAAGDEDEGMEGAAAKAAARAASLGVAAASTGYSSLGGVDEHVRPACSCLIVFQSAQRAWFKCLPAAWSCLGHIVTCIVMLSSDCSLHADVMFMLPLACLCAVPVLPPT